MFEIDSTLWLVPTALERDRLQRYWKELTGNPLPMDLELCGFGPVLSSAVTLRLLLRRSPKRVVLLGIAGTYCAETLPVGQATWFQKVMTDAVGAETEQGCSLPSMMGFPQWQSTGTEATIWESLSLSVPVDTAPQNLLTVGRASGSQSSAQLRKQTMECQAEDMEGFAVAAACHLEQTPCSILRGISNQAGDRNASHWQVDAALKSVVSELCRRLLPATDL